MRRIELNDEARARMVREYRAGARIYDLARKYVTGKMVVIRMLREDMGAEAYEAEVRRRRQGAAIQNVMFRQRQQEGGRPVLVPTEPPHPVYTRPWL
jgi:hypothetical protein